MSNLRYLTVQDVLWMNLQITGRVNHYRYARLEEATYYQYAYGDVIGVLPQAARLLSGFARLTPFDGGNDATALLSALTFIELNGGTIEADDDTLCNWGRRALRTIENAQDALATVVSPILDDADHGHGHVATVREKAQEILGRYPQTLAALTETPV